MIERLSQKHCHRAVHSPKDIHAIASPQLLEIGHSAIHRTGVFVVQAEAKVLGKTLLATLGPSSPRSAPPLPAGDQATRPAAEPGSGISLAQQLMEAGSQASASSSSGAAASQAAVARLESLKDMLIRSAELALRQLEGVPVPTAPGQIVHFGSSKR